MTEWRSIIHEHARNAILITCGTYVMLIVLRNHRFLTQLTDSETLSGDVKLLKGESGVIFDWTAGLSDGQAITVVTTLVLLSAAIGIAAAAAPRVSTESTLYDQVVISQWGATAARLGWWTSGLAGGVALTRFPDTVELGLLLALTAYGAGALAVSTGQRVQDEHLVWLADPSRKNLERARCRLDSKPGVSGHGRRSDIISVTGWLLATALVMTGLYIMAFFLGPGPYHEEGSIHLTILSVMGSIVVLWILMQLIVITVLVPLLYSLTAGWKAWARGNRPMQIVAISFGSGWVSLWIIVGAVISAGKPPWGSFPLWVVIEFMFVFPCAVAGIIVGPMRKKAYGSALFASIVRRGVQRELDHIDKLDEHHLRRLALPPYRP